MDIEKTSIPDLLIMTPIRRKDDRGWFEETYNASHFAVAGIALTFVQDNHSNSVAVGTLRGLHFQTPPHAQDKLVRCSKGTIFDVGVDIRRGSPTYAKWFGIELSADNGKQLLVPKGFLHGFVTRSADAEVQYKCTDVYAPDCDAGIRWDDPDIGIDWGLTGEPVLSGKDRIAPLLRDYDSPFVYEGVK